MRLNYCYLLLIYITGSEGSKNGLVDKLGDFDDAIEMAATLAN
ncbi:Periplasmic serine protease (ClpP class), partial [Gilliamella apis SCGC AB-598-P17]